MSEAPLFKRSGTKSKPKTSSRSISSNADDHDASPPPTGESPMALAAKLKAKNKRPKAQSKLSFGAGNENEDNDGEVFQIKKSSLSRKIKLGASLNIPSSTPPQDLDQANISPATRPMYSKEYLSELKASTSAPPAPLPDDMLMDVDTTLDPDDVADALGFGIREGHGIPVDTPASIPSASAILAAKAKRDRLKKSGNPNETDFISLSVVKKGEASDVYQGPHPDSRLMREEDDLGEGDDDMAEYTGAKERIALGKKGRKEEEKRRRAGMIEAIEDGQDDDDEEAKEWEAAQIRRGAAAEGEEQTKPSKHEKKVYKPAPVPTSTPIPTLPPTITRLDQALVALTSAHASHTTSMSSLASERTALEEKETDLRDIVSKTERKRAWFTAFREWVESVATFLDDKMPRLEKLEDEYVSLLRERTEMVKTRRREDNEDDLCLFLTLPEPPRGLSEELDDLGRTVSRATLEPVHSPVRRARRSTRTDRRAVRASRSSKSTQEDGYSTDSSLPPSDAADFNTAMSSLTTDFTKVLSDVRSEEFRDPRLGAGKWFGEWRDQFPDTYTNAWGGLGCVSAWEFWVRLEMGGWNPMQDGRTLDSFEWYSGLYDYSRPDRWSAAQQGDDENMEDAELGPDGDLISSMLGTAVVPRVCKIIEGGGFDPFSSSHLRRLIDLAEQIEASLNRDHMKFEALLQSVTLSFRTALTELRSQLPNTSLSAPPSTFDPASIPGRQSFLMHTFKLLTNLLKWRKYCSERFGVGEIVSKLVGEIMLPIAEGGWEVGGEAIMSRVIKAMPTEIIPSALRSHFP